MKCPEFDLLPFDVFGRLHTDFWAVPPKSSLTLCCFSHLVAVTRGWTMAVSWTFQAKVRIGVSLKSQLQGSDSKAIPHRKKCEIISRNLPPGLNGQDRIPCPPTGQSLAKRTCFGASHMEEEWTQRSNWDSASKILYLQHLRQAELRPLGRVWEG